MELAVVSGSSHRLSKLKWDTDSQRTSGSEIVCGRNGEPIHIRQQELDSCWAEYLKEQLNWLRANVVPGTSKTVNPW